MGLCWYFLIFPSYLPKSNYGEMLQAWFIESPDRTVMWEMAFLTVFGLFMAASYFCGLGRARGGAVALCAAGAFVAGMSWFLTATLAVFFTFPLLYTVPLLFTASRKK
jgi:hypothetical protein